MQSSGGVLPSTGIRARPVEMLQSGPAAGVIAAMRVAERLHHPDLITLDMGGTSTDVCLVAGGIAEISAEREVGRAAGGARRASTSPTSARVAAASPGSTAAACSGRPAQCRGASRSRLLWLRRHRAAVTDALVQLGWLRPAHFLGGRMPLYPERSTASLEPTATSLGQDATTFARVDDRHCRRQHHTGRCVWSRSNAATIRSRYALYAYGGMGPMVGALVADEMRIERVVVPPHPGLFSALGLLVADLGAPTGRRASRR